MVRVDESEVGDEPEDVDAVVGGVAVERVRNEEEAIGAVGAVRRPVGFDIVVRLGTVEVDVETVGLAEDRGDVSRVGEDDSEVLVSHVGLGEEVRDGRVDSRAVLSERDRAVVGRVQIVEGSSVNGGRDDRLEDGGTADRLVHGRC